MPTALILTAGVFIPVNLAPTWLRVLTLLNPLTYVVDGLRQVLLTDAGPDVASVAVRIGSHSMTVWQDVIIALLLGLPLLAISLRRVRSSFAV